MDDDITIRNQKNQPSRKKQKLLRLSSVMCKSPSCQSVWQQSTNVQLTLCGPEGWIKPTCQGNTKNASPNLLQYPAFAHQKNKKKRCTVLKPITSSSEHAHISFIQEIWQTRRVCLPGRNSSHARVCYLMHGQSAGLSSAHLFLMVFSGGVCRCDKHATA